MLKIHTIFKQKIREVGCQLHGLGDAVDHMNQPASFCYTLHCQEYAGISSSRMKYKSYRYYE